MSTYKELQIKEPCPQNLFTGRTQQWDKNGQDYETKGRYAGLATIGAVDHQHNLPLSSSNPGLWVWCKKPYPWLRPELNKPPTIHLGLSN